MINFSIFALQIFPCVDENGLPSDLPNDDKFFFDFWTKSYAAFNRGSDDFSTEYAEFQAELEFAYEIDEENLRKLEHQRRDLGQTLAQLQEVPK